MDFYIEIGLADLIYIIVNFSHDRSYSGVLA